MQTCQIIQISDSHLGALGQPPDHGQKIDPWEKLQLIIQDMRRSAIQPDLIVFSGDVIQAGGVADYQRLQRVTTALASEFRCAVRVILGNHDQRAAFYQGYLGYDPGPYFVERFRLNNMDFYFLDSKSSQPNERGGRLSSAQLRWLGKHLRQAPTKRAFLFLHHPLMTGNLTGWRSILLQNTSELLSVLKGHNIGGIFSGQLHFTCSYLTGDHFLNVVAGSASYQFNAQEPPTQQGQESCCYQVIKIVRGQVSIETRQLLVRMSPTFK